MPVLLRASGSSKSGELLTLSDLTALAIAPPHAVPERESMAGPDSNEEQSTSSSSSSSSSESVIGDSFTFSSLSSTGQLTPPTTDIADHRRDIDIEQNINKHVIQDDDVDERVQLSPSSSLKGKSRSRQSTARRCAESEHVAVPRSEVRRYAAEIVRKEAKALLDLAARLDAEPDDVLHPQHEQVPRLKPEQTQDAYTRAVEILKSMDSHGRIIMTGVGKSGLLARKAVATFNSFGKFG